MLKGNDNAFFSRKSNLDLSDLKEFQITCLEEETHLLTAVMWLRDLKV